jgi:outer membrane protein assembly factor BamA
VERDVVIDVEEAADIDINYGLRFSTEDRFEVLASLRFPNLLGSAQNLGLTFVADENQTLFRPTYDTPFFFKYRINSSIFLSRETESDELFTSRAWNLTFQQTKRFWRNYDLQWSYTYKYVNAKEKVESPIPFDFTLRQSILTASLILDRRDDLIQPTRGRFWNLTIQYAPEALGSDVKFLKFYGQLFTFFPLAENVIWASSYRAGLADAFDQTLQRNDRFRAGGASTVRGFEQDSLGPQDPSSGFIKSGEAVFVLNQEIRFPIYRWFQGVGFYDAGNVYLQTSDFNPLDLRHSAGVGVRVALPFGLLRLDWARVLDPKLGEQTSQIWFNLNHAF